MMRSLLTAVVFLCSLATASVAIQNEATIDPSQAAEYWLAQLRSRYRSAPVSEVITITVEQGTMRGRELIRYESAPLEGFREPEIMIDLGAHEIWTRPPGNDEDGPGLIRVAHELDARHYYEAEPIEGATTRETIQQRLPPLLIPHLSLALGGPLFPEFGPITWTGASEDRSTLGVRTVELEGIAGEAEVRLAIEAGDTPRVIEAEIKAQPGPVRILIESSPGVVRDERLGYDVSRRERLSSLAELQERPGDLRAGDPMPEMPLVYFNLEGIPEVEAYRHRLILYFEGDNVRGALPTNASVGLDALRKAAEEIGPVTRIEPTGYIDAMGSGEDDIQTIEIGMSDAVKPNTLWYTISERRSIRRFSAESDSVIVIASKDGTVAGVIDLADVRERVNKEGRDEVVASIASRVVELCRLIDRREDGLPGR